MRGWLAAFPLVAGLPGPLQGSDAAGMVQEASVWFPRDLLLLPLSYCAEYTWNALCKADMYTSDAKYSISILARLTFLLSKINNPSFLIWKML
jgi:hypothetical protein